MNQRSSKSGSIAIAVIGVALCGFSLYGFGTHEITLHRPKVVRSEYRQNRSREVTLVGWPADVVRLGFATCGLLLVSYAFCPDRQTAVRNSRIAIVAWLIVSSVYVVWCAMTS